MSDDQTAGDRLGASRTGIPRTGDSPIGSAPPGADRANRSVWGGYRNRPATATIAAPEREISRHAWLSGVPLDPEERQRVADDLRP